jgi:hypothetical protein
MNAEEKREQRLRLQEDHIGRSLAESEQSGELRSAPSFGKPLNFGDGYEQTPEPLRMAYKALKDAGYVPPEVELMREIEALRLLLDNTPEHDSTVPALRQSLADKRQRLTLRLEGLRSSGHTL